MMHLQARLTLALTLTLTSTQGVAEELRALLPAAKELLLVECIVSMNAVRDVGGAGAKFHWVSPRDASNPAFLLAAPGATVAAAMGAAGLLAVSTDRFDDVAYAKLIINCGMNAVNALSGVGSRECLRCPVYRRLMLGAMDEVLAVYRAAGISYDTSGVMKFVKFAQLPGPLVWLATHFLLADRAHSSMWSDLQHNRKTEVGYLNGHVAQMGARLGVPTPINDRLVELVRAAEQAASGHPCIGAAQMAAGLDLRGAGGAGGSRRGRSVTSITLALGAWALLVAAAAMALRGA